MRRGKRPWWWLFVPYPFSAADGKRLRFSWIRFSDVVILVAMGVTTYGVAYGLVLSGHLSADWVRGSLVLLSLRWGFAFLFLALLALFMWQPDAWGNITWKQAAGLASFSLALAGVAYAVLGHTHYTHFKAMLIYSPLGATYMALWSIPRAIWRSTRARSLEPPSDAEAGPVIWRRHR